MIKNIILTGQPHSGKSTLLQRLLPDIPQRRGFITREILQEGVRRGFEVWTDDNIDFVLAHVEYSSLPYRVSRYGVDVAGFEAILPPLFEYQPNQLLYLDEIGQMELFSDKFKSLVENYLDAPNLFMGTLSAVYHDEFTTVVRSRKDILIVEITPENREQKYQEMKEWLKINNNKSGRF